jgi:hypothetical protein
VLIRAKNNTEFNADCKPVEKLEKNLPENVINKKLKKFAVFQIFTRDHKIDWVITFCW